MNAPGHLPGTASFLAETHEVVNVSRELTDFNPYLQDAALQAAVHREGAQWAHDSLITFGELTGSAEYLEQGVLANHCAPELDTHDRFGHRIDRCASIPRTTG